MVFELISSISCLSLSVLSSEFSDGSSVLSVKNCELSVISSEFSDGSSVLSVKNSKLSVRSSELSYGGSILSVHNYTIVVGDYKLSVDSLQRQLQISMFTRHCLSISKADIKVLYTF